MLCVWALINSSPKNIPPTGGKVYGHGYAMHFLCMAHGPYEPCEAWLPRKHAGHACHTCTLDMAMGKSKGPHGRSHAGPWLAGQTRGCFATPAHAGEWSRVSRRASLGCRRACSLPPCMPHAARRAVSSARARARARASASDPLKL
jgi:hypothetical protein